jgi:uncharacterized protein (TIGR02001 family)
MSMKASLAKTVGAAGVALLALTGAAAAEDREFAWSVTLGGTSDYVFRGYSFNNEDPAFQASVNASYGILYAGAWGSNVQEGNGPAEIDLYTGIKPVWGPVTFDFGFLYYTYSNEDLNYYELKAGASGSPFKNFTLGGTFYIVPDQDNLNENWTLEGTAAYALPAVGIFTPTISGVLGYSEQTDDVADGFDFTGFGVNDYTYWNVGLALAVEKFTFDFRYWDTNIADNLSAGLADERFVFSASVTLP